MMDKGSLNVHWVDGPEDEGEATNGSEEGGSLVVLGLGGLATVDGELIDDNEVGNAGHGIPAPLGRLVNRKGSEETSQDHDDISNDGNENTGTAETGQETEIKKQEWGGETPVDITSPVDLTVNSVIGVGEVLLGVLDEDLVLANTITNSHGIVGESGEGGDESSQDVEETFLL